jgi:DNA-binding NarL/FixJ family response regulator
MSPPITVLLADDHVVVRKGFRALLELEADIAVVGEARHGRETIELARKLKPDVVVMDIAMPVLNGVGATRKILEILPATKVLILSAHSDDPYIDRVMAVGAVGFLVKQASAQSLSKAIREVKKGNTFFSPSVAKSLHEQQRDGKKRRVLAKKGAKGLTSREMEVIQLVAEGAGNKQIAADLGISIKTVETHRQHLMNKLDIHDTAGLTRYAIAHGIIENRVRVRIV